MSDAKPEYGIRWHTDDCLLRAIESAKAVAARDGRATLSAADIACGLEGANPCYGDLKESQMAPGSTRLLLDESARDLLRPSDVTGRLTAAEVKARLQRIQIVRVPPFDTVEEHLLKQLRAWRLLAAAAEARYGSGAFCPPEDRHVDPARARSIRREAARSHRVIESRLEVTDWHPRRNLIGRLTTEHGLSRLARRCILALYPHDEFGIWPGRASPVALTDLARATVETVGETDLVETATTELADADLAAMPRMVAAAPTKSCSMPFRTAAAGDCPSDLLRRGPSVWLEKGWPDYSGAFNEHRE